VEIWAWAESTYARPGVAEACLALQDEHGQNVCLLLWAAWAGAAAGDGLQEAVAVARRWEREVVGPLRVVRRALKPPAPPVADAAREGLRRRVAATELEGERVLLETLAGLAPRATGGGGPALPALRAAAAAWGRFPPDSALAALAAAID